MRKYILMLTNDELKEFTEIKGADTFFRQNELMVSDVIRNVHIAELGEVEYIITLLKIQKERPKSQLIEKMVKHGNLQHVEFRERLEELRRDARRYDLV